MLFAVTAALWHTFLECSLKVSLLLKRTETKQATFSAAMRPKNWQNFNIIIIYLCVCFLLVCLLRMPDNELSTTRDPMASRSSCLTAVHHHYYYSNFFILFLCGWGIPLTSRWMAANDWSGWTRGKLQLRVCGAERWWFWLRQNLLQLDS